jgi:hypothetical protein
MRIHPPGSLTGSPAPTRETRQASDLSRGGRRGSAGSALAGCQSGGSPAADGPLSSGDGPHDPLPRGAVCTPYGGPQTNGLQVFTNYRSTTVILDRVVLLRPRNQRLLGAYAVPSGNFSWETRTAGRPGVPRCHRAGNTASASAQARASGMRAWSPAGSARPVSAVIEPFLAAGQQVRSLVHAPDLKRGLNR